MYANIHPVILLHLHSCHSYPLEISPLTLALHYLVTKPKPSTITALAAATIHLIIFLPSSFLETAHPSHVPCGMLALSDNLTSI